MECYRVKVPEGRRLTGSTIGGQRVPIPPGEYHVHRLMPKLTIRPRAAALRFVGACGDGKDVHITVPADMDIGDALSVEVMRLECTEARGRRTGARSGPRNSPHATEMPALSKGRG